MHKFQTGHLTRFALVTVILACAGVAPAAAAFQLQNVVNAVQVDAAAGDLGGLSHDGPYYIVANPANASATASRGGYTGHGDAYAAYDAAPYELSMIGTGNASGGFGVDGGAVGNGHAYFSAEQNFGPEPVLVHIVGTFYREHSPATTPATDAGYVSFHMGSYSQTLYGENGTLTFDDLVTFNGNVSILTELYARAPGAHSDATSYEVTLTIVQSSAAVPEASSIVVWSILALAIGGASWFRSKKATA
jgi:hypothetical protein